MSKDSAMKLVAGCMRQSGTLNYVQNCGIDPSTWATVRSRIQEGADQIQGLSKQDTDGVSYLMVCLFLAFYAAEGESPEGMARRFEASNKMGGLRMPGSAPKISIVEKPVIIKAVLGAKSPNAFSPMPVGEGNLMIQNTFGHWFTLADTHPLPVLLEHARAHHVAAEVMFSQRNTIYQGMGWHDDGAKTTPRAEVLAKLEMGQIIRLGLSGEALLSFFIWWAITGEISISRQLASKYADHRQAANDALVVFQTQIQEPAKLHNETDPVFEFRGVPVYFLQGACVPEVLIKTPADQLNPHAVRTCTNPAARKRLVEKITYPRLLTAIGRVIDSANPLVQEYELWGLDLLDRNIRVLRIGPRLAPHPDEVWWEAVGGACQTVADALAFRMRGLPSASDGRKRYPAFIT